MKLSYLGWIVGAALVAVLAATGFQGGTAKFGVVDVPKVFNESDFAKAQLVTLTAYGKPRQDMLTFLYQYRPFTAQQATRYHELSLKMPLSPAEKAELDTIKNAVIASDKRLKELQTKTTPTPAESTELQDLSRRVQTTSDTAQHWNHDAQDEFAAEQQRLTKAGMDKVKEAIKQAAAGQGYTLVFSTDTAPYGANDLTAEALKVMNKK